jgi:hypothetical protein
MLKYLDKFFPEISNYIKNISIGRRLLFLIAIMLLFFATQYFFKNGVIGYDFLQKKIELTILSILLFFLLILSLSLFLSFVLRSLKKRKMLIDFYREWVEFSTFLFIFINKIDVYLAHEKKTKMGKFDEVTSEVKKYHSHRKKLRELLHVIKEENLVVSRIPNWEEMKGKYEIIEERGYETPFSFLLDFQNPIAFVNHHGKEAWEAMHVSNEFIEHLVYEHNYLKGKIKIT